MKSEEEAMQILEAYDLTGSLRSAASLEGTRDMSDALKGRNSDLVLDRGFAASGDDEPVTLRKLRKRVSVTLLSGVLTPTVHCVPTAAVV
jgi:hypothetical protein